MLDDAIYLANALAAEPIITSDQPCSTNSIAISIPGTQRLEEGQLLIIKAARMIEIKPEIAAQTQPFIMRC